MVVSAGKTEIANGYDAVGDGGASGKNVKKNIDSNVIREGGKPC